MGKKHTTERSSFRPGDTVRFQHEGMAEEAEAQVKAVHEHGLELWDPMYEFIPFETSYIARRINGHNMVTQPKLPLVWNQRYCERCAREPATARSDYCRECQDERKRESRRRYKRKMKHQTAQA